MNGFAHVTTETCFDTEAKSSSEMANIVKERYFLMVMLENNEL